jgi:phenylalanyl-tRNA synthetase beta chain
MAVWAADRAARLMSDLTGASVCLNRLDDHPSPLVQPEVTLRYARADLLLGINVPPSDQVSFLEGLGFEVLDRNDSEATFKTPSWRHDVKMEADLIEEVARLWGFEKIPTTLPSVRQTEERLPSRETVLRHFKQYIAGQGLTEFFSWTFSCQQEVIKASLPPSRSELVAISNPLNGNLAAMRTSLLPGMLTSIARNLNHGVTDVSAFEIGSIYLPVHGQELPSEQATLVIALVGGTGEKHWSRPEQAFDFYDLKGYCEVAIDYFGLAPTFSSADIPPFLDKSQSGGIVLDGQTVGSLGLVSEKVCRAFDINRPVYFMELELEPLLASAKTYPRFAAIPKFPPSLRDMALLVDTTTEAGSMLDAARQAGGKLLTDASVFDVYSGKQLPQGKKSIALSLVFQSADKTLTDVDTQKAFDRIVQALAEQFGAALR